ncbi:hypothetical protein QZM89_27450, partial [Burkholderia gladioli]
MHLAAAGKHQAGMAGQLRRLARLAATGQIGRARHRRQAALGQALHRHRGIGRIAVPDRDAPAARRQQRMHAREPGSRRMIPTNSGLSAVGRLPANSCRSPLPVHGHSSTCSNPSRRHSKAEYQAARKDQARWFVR